MPSSDPTQTGTVCDHADVRYFRAEKGAVACMDCGRLFGNLIGQQFHAHNPNVETFLCKHCEGTGTLTDGITECPRCDGRGATA